MTPLIWHGRRPRIQKMKCLAQKLTKCRRIEKLWQKCKIEIFSKMEICSIKSCYRLSTSCYHFTQDGPIFLKPVSMTFQLQKVKSQEVPIQISLVTAQRKLDKKLWDWNRMCWTKAVFQRLLHRFKKEQASPCSWLCAQCAHGRDYTPVTQLSWRLTKRSKLSVHTGTRTGDSRSDRHQVQDFMT